jgi:hypothetical protein
MELQSFTLDEHTSFKIVTNNFVQGAELKAIFKCFDGTRLMSADAIVALFQCYPLLKQHFARMDYLGQIDYIVHKDDDEIWTCISITKLRESQFIHTKSWKLRFYDLKKKRCLIIPFSRETLRFLYSRQNLVRKALEYWDDQMDIILQEMHSRTRITEISLLNECKRSLLAHTGKEEKFIAPKIYRLLPDTIQNYLSSWNEHNEHYSSIAEDEPKIEDIVDNDSEFDF